MKKLSKLVFVCVLAISTLGADIDRQRFEKLGHEMMCTCGCNQILLECNHVGCPVSGKMRDELTSGLQGGSNNQSILQSFVSKYGPTVLAAPTTSGFNLTAWIMPFAFLLTGLLAVILVVRRWKLRPASPGVAGEETSARLEGLRARARQETEL